jgi:hypothetical protein
MPLVEAIEENQNYTWMNSKGVLILQRVYTIRGSKVHVGGRQSPGVKRS